jgi:hypothetical protein
MLISWIDSGVRIWKKNRYCTVSIFSFFSPFRVCLSFVSLARLSNCASNFFLAIWIAQGVNKFSSFFVSLRFKLCPSSSEVSICSILFSLLSDDLPSQIDEGHKFIMSGAIPRHEPEYLSWMHSEHHLHTSGWLQSTDCIIMEMDLPILLNWASSRAARHIVYPWAGVALNYIVVFVPSSMPTIAGDSFTRFDCIYFLILYIYSKSFFH